MISSMKCPIDDTQLAIMERQNVEIDYCPQCRGVWLDRGELDKIISKSDETPGKNNRDDYRSDRPEPRSERRPDDVRYEDTYRRDDHDSRGKHDDRQHSKKKKRESFIGDLFDF